jgi:hypothetical protein
MSLVKMHSSQSNNTQYFTGITFCPYDTSKPACADQCKRLTGITGAKCDTREILSGRRYSRSNKIPRKTFYFKRILFSFPRKSADLRPIPIPVLKINKQIIKSGFELHDNDGDNSDGTSLCPNPYDDLQQEHFGFQQSVIQQH